MLGDETLEKIKSSVSTYVKKWSGGFIADLVLSVITYSLLMIHQLVNQLDGLWHGSESVAAGWELSIGRWLWRYIDKARFHISSDPFASVSTLVLFIIATIIMLEIFEVGGSLSRVAISMMFLVSVSVCNHLSFRFQSLTFAFGIFFATLAVLILVRIDDLRISVPLSALFVALSNACYQAFTGVICLLVVLFIAFCIKNNTKTDKQLAVFFLKALISGLLGATVYYGVLQIEFTRYNVVMNEYNGASDYNIKGIVSNLPQRILTAYHDYFEYFENSYFRINIVPAFKYVYLLLVCLLVLLGLRNIKETFKAKNGIVRSIVYIVCILLVPVAANVCLLVAYNSFMSIQMTVPMAMSIPALMCLCLDNRDIGNVFLKIAGYLTWLLVLVLIYTQFFMVQYDQQSMFMGRQSCLTMAEQIDSYLIKHDLLHPYYKYVFVGKPSDNREFYLNDFFGTANEYAQFGKFVDDPGGARMSWQGLWWYERGIRMDFSDEEKWAKMFEDEAVGSMPIFPEEGSCVLYDDVIVVKVSQPSTLDN